jgi:hypothetical protein
MPMAVNKYLQLLEAPCTDIILHDILQPYTINFDTIGDSVQQQHLHDHDWHMISSSPRSSLTRKMANSPCNP